MRGSAAASIALGLLLTQHLARAEPTKAECVTAADEAQRLEHDRRLIEARAAFRVCGAPTCPSLVRVDCAQWLERAGREQPRVVFVAKDASGTDLADVVVTMDGKPFAERLTGQSTEVDPGEHTFVLTVPGGLSVTRHLVVVVGEQDRRELVVFRPPLPERLATPDRHPLRIGGIAALAAAGVGLAIGIATGSAALSEASSVESACPQNRCTSDQSSNISSGRTLAGVSTASFVVAGVLTAAGLFGVLYATAPAKSETAWRLSVGPGAVMGEF